MKASEPKPGEILSKWEGHPGLSLNDDKVRTGRQRVIAAMQEYADLYHKEKLRGDLKDFNSFAMTLEVNGEFPLIDSCIEEFIKTIK